MFFHTNPLMFSLNDKTVARQGDGGDIGTQHWQWVNPTEPITTDPFRTALGDGVCPIISHSGKCFGQRFCPAQHFLTSLEHIRALLIGLKPAQIAWPSMKDAYLKLGICFVLNNKQSAWSGFFLTLRLMDGDACWGYDASQFCVL
jgi:hypothetical protein